MNLTFGKYKGNALENVPLNYLWFLTCWDMVDRKRISIWNRYLENDDRRVPEKVADLSAMELDDTFDSARVYVARKHLKCVYAARELWNHKNICCMCRKPLMPFRVTADWEHRYLHKKCFIAQ
jgi:hypothetical protein